MNILAIDTSTAYCSVTLFAQNGQKFTQTKHIPRRHNEELLPMVSDLITQAGLLKKAINLLAYGVGPGSFVGVRLAASAMQAMALSLNCPVVGFSSMQAIAMATYYQFKAKNISVILDARMSDVYFGQYYWHENLQLIDTTSEACLKLVDFKAQIAGQNLGFITGDILAGIDVELNSIDYCPDTQFLLPLIQYNYQQLKQKQMLGEIVLPIYLQGTSPWQKLP